MFIFVFLQGKWINLKLVPGMKMELELQEELLEWEMKLEKRNMSRMYKTEKRYRDPRREVLNNYRHHHGTTWYRHGECKEVRKMTNRKFRRKLKRELFNETYYRVIPHDYRTYGWITS